MTLENMFHSRGGLECIDVLGVVLFSSSGVIQIVNELNARNVAM